MFHEFADGWNLQTDTGIQFFMSFQLSIILFSFIIASHFAFSLAYALFGKGSISRRAKHFRCEAESLKFDSTSQWDLKLSSPCKLNLFLRIISRRPNGYHDLASLFQTVSLSDTLYLSKIDGVDEDEIYV